MHIGILGCGKIAKTHAEILRKNSVRISFASRNLKQAEIYRSQFQAELALGSYEEAFTHPDIDTLLICTPNNAHHQNALTALEHGKDLIIEKPLACSIREADEILAKAKEKGRIVLVAENHRYRPSLRAVEKIIATGELGTLKMIRMNIMRTHHFKKEEWRANSQQMGGGPLIDGGIHWVNALLTLGGGHAIEVKALEPPTTSANCPREDSIAILCKFDNGAVGILTYSWGIARSFPFKFFGVFGSKGSIYVANTGMIGFRFKGMLPKPFLLPFHDWKGYHAMWQDFLTTLRNRQPEQCLCNGPIGRRDLAFIEEAYQDAASSIQTQPIRKSR